MRYLAVLMLVAVASGLVGCDGSGGLGLGGGRIEPFESDNPNFFVSDNCWYEGGVEEGLPHGRGRHLCVVTGIGRVIVYEGEWKYGLRHGQGTLTQPDNIFTFPETCCRKYVGEFKDGQLHGQGTDTFADGSKYVGGFKEYVRHGQGTSYNPDGSVRRKGWWCSGVESNGPCPGERGEPQPDPRGSGQSGQRPLRDANGAKSLGEYTDANGAKYVGELEDGLPNGQGTSTWTNGSSYVGDFRNGKRNGVGTHTYADGAKYIGEWLNDKRHGEGTYIWLDGSKYVGQWKDGRYHGQGIKYNADGSVRRKGWWCGMRESRGPCRDKSSAGGGTEHEGKLDQGASVSTGRVTINGDEYVGELKDGKQNGQGTYTWPDGATYVGEFKDGLPNGQGTYTRAEGDKYVGEFKDGLPNGQGILYYPDGSVERKGWFCNDRPSDGPCSN